MLAVLSWWIIIQILGILALPLSLRLFRWMPDHGYSFSKALGLLLTSYVLWLGASTRFLRNDLGGIFLSVLVVAGCSAWIYFRYFNQAENNLSEILRSRKKVILAGEILFAVAFAAWAVLRAYAPEKIMNAGGEKFMEIAFLNGILNSPTFPPLDPWLSGFSISYYYFGYVMMSLVVRLSGVVSGVGFDLYDALLFALTLLNSFGVTYNLIAARLHSGSPRSGVLDRKNTALRYGFLGALFVAVLGNLEGLLEALHSARLLPESFWNWINIPDLTTAAATGSFYPGGMGWWWWRGSRVLQDLDLLYRPMGISPITEFPFFSFLLGDNHPHVLALPFVLVAIALALNLYYRQVEKTPLEHEASATAQETQNIRHLLPPAPGMTIDQPTRLLPPALFDNDWFLFVMYSLVLGGVAFLNTWDFPIYLGLTILAYALGSRCTRCGLGTQHKQHPREENGEAKTWEPAQGNDLNHAAMPFIANRLLVRTVALGLWLGIAAILMYIFFYVGFSSQAGGILPYVFPPTRLPQYLVMFGPFIFILLCYLVLYVKAAYSSGEDHRSGLQQVGNAWLMIILTGVGLIVVTIVAASISAWISQAAQDPNVQNVLGGMDIPSAVREILLARLRNPWLFLLASALVALAASGALRQGALRQGALRQTAHQQTPSPLLRPLLNEYTANDEPDSSPFVMLLIFLGVLLTWSVEFFYLRDQFMLRLNTIFKFYFQGWVMMALASAYALWWIEQRSERWLQPAWRYTIQAIATMMIVAGMIYPLMAIPSRVNEFQGEPNLDGASGIANSNPDDWAAIEWLRQNATKSAAPPVILEAPGGSYNYEGRISAFTGFPAVLGWAVHENQWRGNYDEQNKREPDILSIYTNNDASLTLDLLYKWEVKYVILGAPERSYIQEKCQAHNLRCNVTTAERKFDQLLELAFSQGQIKVYTVP